MKNAQLQPQALGANRYGALGYGEYRIGLPKNIHQINGAGNGCQIRVAAQAQHGLFSGIYRNDVKTCLQQIGGDAVAGSRRIAGQTDHGDTTAGQTGLDGFGLLPEPQISRWDHRAKQTLGL